MNASGIDRARCAHNSRPSPALPAGDWERVTVLVCKARQTPRRVVLSQHGWNQHLNCDAGECTLNGAQPSILSQRCPLSVAGLSVAAAAMVLSHGRTAASAE